MKKNLERHAAIQADLARSIDDPHAAPADLLPNLVVRNGTRSDLKPGQRHSGGSEVLLVVEEGADVEDCIIMDYVRVGKGAKLRKVIVDRHNAIEPGARIGFDRAEDEKKYKVSSGGVVVIPLGKVGYYARDSRGMGPGYAE